MKSGEIWINIVPYKFYGIELGDRVKIIEIEKGTGMYEDIVWYSDEINSHCHQYRNRFIKFFKKHSEG